MILGAPSRRGPRAARLLLGLALVALLTGACVNVDARGDGLTPTPAERGASPEPAASPTMLASGEYLEIEGQRVLDVVVPSPDIGPRYALTADGLYRQAERNTWARIGDRTEADTVIADPGNTDVLYRGGHPGCDTGGDPIPFERSDDGGATWERLPAASNVRPLIATGGPRGPLYGARCRFAVSVDGGETWKSYQTVPGFWVDHAALAGNRLYLLHASAGGTSRLSAVDVTNPEQPVIGPVLLEFWGRGVVHATRDRVLVGEPRGVQISYDGGRTWQLSRERLDAVTLSVNALVEPIPHQERAGEYGVLAIAVHPRRDNRILLGTVRGLYMSEDGGRSWGRLTEVAEARIHKLAFAHAGGQLYVTTDEGVAVVKHP